MGFLLPVRHCDPHVQDGLPPIATDDADRPFQCRGRMSSLWCIIKRVVMPFANCLAWQDFRLFALPLRARLRQRCSDCGDGAKQDERIVLRGHETSALPELSRFLIDCIDHQRSATDQSSGLDASLKGMFHQTCTDASSRPLPVRRKLAEEKAGNRIGRLPGAD